MGIIVFNNRSSKDFRIQVETPPGYVYPEKDVEVVHVPGRNGDLLFDSGSFKNVKREYQVSFYNERMDFFEMAQQISKWLNGASGYKILEDSYEPEVYRLARYSGNVTINNIYNQAGKFTLSFDCKPERFYKSGLNKIYISSESSPANINNFTNFDTLPNITIKTNGTKTARFYVNSLLINISVVEHSSEKTYVIGDKVSYYNNLYKCIQDIPEPEAFDDEKWERLYTDTIIIDGEMMDVYDEYGSRNKDVSLTEFPKLTPGNNVITIESGINALEVTPRWWTI